MRISIIHFWMLPFRELMLTFISSSRLFSMMLNSSTRSRHFSTWVWRLVRSSVSLSLRRMVKWVASLAHDFSLTWSFLAVVKLASSVTWWKKNFIDIFMYIYQNYNIHIWHPPYFWGEKLDINRRKYLYMYFLKNELLKKMRICCSTFFQNSKPLN